MFCVHFRNYLQIECAVLLAKIWQKIYMSGEVFYVVESFQGRGLPILFRGVEFGATPQDHSSFHLFMANN